MNGVKSSLQLPREDGIKTSTGFNIFIISNIPLYKVSSKVNGEPLMHRDAPIAGEREK